MPSNSSFANCWAASRVNRSRTSGVSAQSIATLAITFIRALSASNAINMAGTAFTIGERHQLGLTGRLPSAVLALEDQAQRLWQQLQSLPTDLARNLLLEQVHNRNEVLYFKVLSEHLPELLPVVYDPTVGAAIECYSDEYRGQRGVYLSIDRPDEIAESINTLGFGPDDVDLIVCSDAEEILGIGDWGVGGIQIAIGKLAVYIAGAGVDPSRAIAVPLDVGTDNETLLNDPFYLGNRHARHRGADYDAFIQRYIATAQGSALHSGCVGGDVIELQRE